MEIYFVCCQLKGENSRAQCSGIRRKEENLFEKEKSKFVFLCMEKNGQHGTVSNAKNVKKNVPQRFSCYSIDVALQKH